MTDTRRAKRPSKASLARAKLVAVVLSVLAFIGSLATVAIANPATRNRALPAVQSVVIQPPLGQGTGLDVGSLVLPVQPQMPRLRPLTRTRGS
jgi:hypothetical protein